MAAIGKILYNTFFKRTSTFIATVIVASFFFERSFDQVADRIFEDANKGKLWKDIQHKYE